MFGWAAIKLFLGDALKRLLGLLESIANYARLYPREAIIVLLLVVTFFTWRGRQAARVEAAKWEQAFTDQKAGYEKASKEASELALAQVKAVEARNAALAKDAQHAYELGSQAADTALARYVSANRVRPNQVCRSPAPAPAEGGGPGVPPEMPSDTRMVAIREPELQALVEWTKVGVAAHNREVTKIEAGTAIPASELPMPDMPVDR
jgi:hypothetical protein